MIFKLISYIAPILGLSLIGLITFLKNTRERLNLLFFLLATVLSVWLGALFVGDLTISRAVSLWAVRTAVGIGSFIIPALLYFSVHFPVKLRQPTWRFHLFALGPATAFLVLAFTPYLIPAIRFQSGSAHPTQLGILYTLQSAYAVVGFLVGLIITLKKARRVAARQRTQINLVLIGLLVALVVNIVTGFILAITKRSDGYSNFAGSMSFVAFIGTTSYAIVKHRLFDIRLAITRSIGFIMTISIVAVAYSLLVFGIGVPYLTRGRITLISNRPQLLLLLPPTIFIALTFHALQQFIANLTKRIFYQDAYDVRASLDELSDTLISGSDIGALMTGSLAVIAKAIKPSHAVFIVLDEQGGIYRQRLLKRVSPKDAVQLVQGADRLPPGRVVVVDELLAEQRFSQFQSEDIALLLKLGTTRKLLGVLFFGPKQNGRMYTRQDLDLLGVGAKNLSVAIENAKNYEQVSTFAETMRKEVLRATAGLRRANKELKTLDTLKDDFISMASHQLRSPATSVHEAMQMLNHTDVQVAERKQLLQLAEASSERLINVIVDMLSIARIQAGHFIIEKTAVDIAELVDRAILEAAVLAKQKYVVCSFKRPKEQIEVSADRAKLNEMISNYLENAIKYSEFHSTVTLELRKVDQRAYFEVCDSGIGVPPAEREHLFTKFYRANNARKEEPDGNGIGLFVVKAIAAAHGGEAYYKPLAKGSLFGFWIPAT